MRKVLLLLAVCLCARGQTTVTGTLRVPTGDAVSGSCSIQAIGPFTSGSYRVIGSPTVVKFTAGAFSAALVPTDSATPTGQYYRVTCQTPLQTVNGRTVQAYSWGPKIWLVPTSASALDISQVEVSVAPPANYPAGGVLAGQFPNPTFAASALQGSGSKVLTFSGSTSDGCLTLSGGKAVSTGVACGTGTGSGGTARTWGSLLAYTWGQLLGGN